MTLADDAERLLLDATTALPGGGEVRTGQIEMCRAVAEAIDDEKHLIASAGTGTGKSLAYLCAALASGQKVIVATATKALQDQLADKELPHLRKVLDKPFSYAVLKGRSNYICRQRVAEFDRSQGTLDGVADRAQVEVEKLVAWADTTEVGDRAELDFEPSEAAWSAVSVTSRECPGRSKCPAGTECLADRARDKAASADIVVVNSHLLGLNIESDGAILPAADLVIIDEAHQLEDVITSTCGWSITAGRFSAFARTVKSILDDIDTVDEIEDVAALVADALEPLVGNRVNLRESPELESALNRAREIVNEVSATLRKLEIKSDADAIARRDRAVSAANALLGDLTIEAGDADRQVVWVEESFRSPVLRSAPLDVGEVLAPGLWDQTTTVLTSATIPSRLSERLGMIPDAVRDIEVESPFDYAQQAVLYCALDLPEPRSPDYHDAMLPRLEQLMVAAGGRTLGLFTSWRAMEAAAEYLQPRLPGTVYTQRDLPKPALIEAFIDDPESSLLATIGFWQGIDVPGAALTLVTIDRLPFPRPDDPLLSARRDLAGSSAFRDVDLPRATTLLAQGAGRLIRSSDDVGVVAVLDPRLATKKSYRWEFIKALPPFERSRDLDEVLTRLRELRDSADDTD